MERCEAGSGMAFLLVPLTWERKMWQENFDSPDLRCETLIQLILALSLSINGSRLF